MAQKTDSPSGMLVLIARDWRRLLLVVAPFAIAYGILVVVESIAIARIDFWLPVDSFQVAAEYSIYVSAVGLWLQFCIIGAGVAFALNKFRNDDNTEERAGFLGFWCLVCLILALSLMAVDFWAYNLQFSNAERSGATMRWLWLATLYTRIVLYFIAARFLLGASRPVRAGTNRWTAAWTATTTWQSIGLFFVLLVLKLSVNGVLIDLISFTPVVSPFWFVQDELSPMRDIVGQGVQIVAESLGVFLFVGYWLVVDRLVQGDPVGDPTDIRLDRPSS